MKPNILIADDHDVFRLGLKSLLLETGLNVDEARNEKEIFYSIGLKKYDLVLLDYFLPNTNGEQVYSQLLKSNAASKVLFITSLNDSKILSRLLSFNIQGILLKSSSLGSIKKGIIGALNGKIHIDDSIFSLIHGNHVNSDEEKRLIGYFQHLTKREIEIIQLVADGLINKEIADTLDISKRTVEVHRSNILEKIPLKSFYAVVVMAYKFGLIK